MNNISCRARRAVSENRWISNLPKLFRAQRHRVLVWGAVQLFETLLTELHKKDWTWSVTERFYYHITYGNVVVH